MLALRVHEGGVDEDERVAAAADGDPGARAWLVERWTPAIYRFALRMVGDEQDAHDIAQDTMLRVLRSLDRYDPTRPFSTWVFGITRNACIDEHRKRQHRAHDAVSEVVDTAPTPLQAVSREQRADQLHDALAALTPMYREVLVLYHFEHLKYTEIAEVLDLPLGTVMNRIFRARQRLRGIYEDRGIEP